MLGTKDTHLQKVRESWGYQGDEYTVIPPVDALGKRATFRSYGELVGTGRGRDSI